MNILRRVWKMLPTFLLSLALAVAVWVSAIIESDPMQERIYPRPIAIELIGQDPALILTNGSLSNLNLTINAPQSIWIRLNNGEIPIRAVVDLAGLPAGTHSLPVQVQIGVQPVRIVAYSPRTVDIVLEPLITRAFPVVLTRRGEPAIGFTADPPILSQNTVSISGPESIVRKVKNARVMLDITRATENIQRVISVQAIDMNDAVVEGITISPDRLTVEQGITQLGGYRTVVVKVAVTGLVANGYRLTTIYATPPTVTLFSSDPSLVSNLPGYVETANLSLSGAKDDLDVRLPLKLPPGISVVGESTVQVQVGIAAIEGSLTIPNIPVEITGTNPTFLYTLAPERVDVILSGPLPILDRLTVNDVRVVVDLSGLAAGKYQRIPQVKSLNPELKLEAFLPASVEVVITLAPTPTPTPTVNPTTTPTPRR
ncbi:MAG TPA: CdaR family protein [Anaerolineaceae bacterium]